MKLNIFQNPKNGNWVSITSEGAVVVSKEVANSATEAANFISANRGTRLITDDRKSILYGFSAGEEVEVKKLEFSAEILPTDVSAIAKAL